MSARAGLSDSVGQAKNARRGNRRPSVEESASPTLQGSNKRRREMSSEAENSSAKKPNTNTEMTVFQCFQELSKKLEAVPTKDDLINLELNMRQKIGDNAREISRLRIQCDNDRSRLENHIERIVDRRITQEGIGGVEEEAWQLPLTRGPLICMKFVFPQLNLKWWQHSEGE